MISTLIYPIVLTVGVFLILRIFSWVSNHRPFGGTQLPINILLASTFSPKRLSMFIMSGILVEVFFADVNWSHTPLVIACQISSFLVFYTTFPPNDSTTLVTLTLLLSPTAWIISLYTSSTYFSDYSVGGFGFFLLYIWSDFVWEVWEEILPYVSGVRFVNQFIWPGLSTLVHRLI